jgi:ABC-type transport system involved in multi-copper enzyme maturation permease subunit
VLTAIKRALAMIDRPAWIRFLIAIAGLVVAFGTALLSTVFRESGNVVGMAVSAAVALVTAGFYLGIALVVGVAALTSGNNLLFIIIATMLAAILVSGIASARILRGLTLEPSLPKRVFARQPVIAKIALSNTHLTSSFSVSVVPPKSLEKQKHWRWERGTFVFPPNSSPENRWVNWPDLKLRLKETHL